jgi:sugar phosphate isomerase/epimerase
MKKLPVALQLYTVRDQTAQDFEGTVRKVAEMGYDGVQFAGRGLPHKEMKALLKELDLQVAGGHEPLGLLEEDLETLIQEYKEMGSKDLVLPSIPGEWREADDFDPLFAALNEIGKTCYENDMRFSYHNHDFEFKIKIGDQTFFDALYAATDPRYVQAEIDVYWVYFAGLDPVDVIRKYAGRCPLIHMKDMPTDFTEMERPARFAEVGEGQLDMQAIMAACEESGVEWYVVEQDRCERPSLESAEISVDNLQSMMAE